jgi:hypothetical protein
VRFLWAEVVKCAEIHRRMLAQYGARNMHQRKLTQRNDAWETIT